MTLARHLQTPSPRQADFEIVTNVSQLTRGITSNTDSSVVTAPSTGRGDYKYFIPIQTRWNDQDPYDHVNNVVYYEFFDTVVNHWLYKRAGMRFGTDPVIGLCVRSECNFQKPLEYPSVIDAGLRVGKLGRSSIRYECAVFAQETDDIAASGSFVHVYVDAETRRPIPVPEDLRRIVQQELLVIEKDRE